jgi:D-alanyl-D-alanine carboxypeptidase
LIGPRPASLLLSAAAFLALAIGLSSCAEPAAQVVAEPSVASAVDVDADAAVTLAQNVPAYTREELLGRFEPATHPSFSRIPDAWTDKDGIYLRTEVLDACGRMRNAAAAEGVTLVIRSATRNFHYQKGIWERKWERPQYMGWQAVDKARDILTYSAMPGASRHHWGTDIDFNSFENDWFESGEGAEVYTWLCDHAGEYGFHQVYDDKSTGRTGYELERWHWSYLPTAGPMLAAYNTLISGEDLTGAPFSGAETADSLAVLRDFVNGLDLPQTSER